MKTLSILGFLLILTPFVHAKTTWIHAVGIDPTTTSQNFPVFYKSARDFEQTCANSSLHPDCILYLNTNTKLAAGPIPNIKNFKDNHGTADSSQLMRTFTIALANSKPGDTVVLSLEDHGAPVAGLSPSCVFLSDKDFVCENDVRDALKHKPPGVKVFISAYGCFTGAFADLSSKETCVSTGSNRFDFGSSGSRSLWNAVKERHLTTLTNLRQPMFKESGLQSYLASQLILRQLCRSARKKIGDSAISEISAAAAVPVLENENSCRDPDMTARKVADLIKQVMPVLSKTAFKSCAEMSLPDPACAALKKLRQASPRLKVALGRLAVLANKETNTYKWLVTNAAKNEKINKEASALLKHVTRAETKELADSFALGQEPDWSKFPAKDRVNAKAAWKLEQPFLSAIRGTNKVKAETDSILSLFRKNGYYDSLVTLQNCLFKNALTTPQSLNDPALAKELIDLRKDEGKFPRRQFTVQDYKDARECEASIHF